jgi:hypothetical protein
LPLIVHSGDGAGKTGTQYHYIRTARELKEVIDLFHDSNCRYLHISCHADSRSMATTFDVISYAGLGEVLRPFLKGKRVFVSAGQMASENLAKEIMIDTGCCSLIGPKRSRLLRFPQDAEKMGQAACARAKNLYSAAQVSKRMRSLCLELVAS